MVVNSGSAARSNKVRALLINRHLRQVENEKKPSIGAHKCLLRQPKPCQVQRHHWGPLHSRRLWRSPHQHQWQQPLLDCWASSARPIACAPALTPTYSAPPSQSAVETNLPWNTENIARSLPTAPPHQARRPERPTGRVPTNVSSVAPVPQHRKNIGKNQHRQQGTDRRLTAEGRRHQRHHQDTKTRHAGFGGANQHRRAPANNHCSMVTLLTTSPHACVAHGRDRAKRSAVVKPGAPDEVQRRPSPASRRQQTRRIVRSRQTDPMPLVYGDGSDGARWCPVLNGCVSSRDQACCHGCAMDDYPTPVAK